MSQYYHFVGIAGRGMNPLAQYLKVQGHRVSGSDRCYKSGEDSEIFSKLTALGISILPQNGIGINEEIDNVIISSAIEEDNQDIVVAKAKGISIVNRAQALAKVFNNSAGVAIGGTSGKTSVTGMLATILYQEVGYEPTVFLGGELIAQFQPQYTGNLLMGQGELFCIEADESDGTIDSYYPQTGVITNISKDHHEVGELINLFQVFANNTKRILIINGDDPNCSQITFPNKRLTFGLTNSCDLKGSKLREGKGHISFVAQGREFNMAQWGMHNMENALAATATAWSLGMNIASIASSLEKYKGMKRRLELIGGTTLPVAVFDDYAHNPSKIMASITSIKKHFSRVAVIYQCHGFQPTRFMWDDLVSVFGNLLRAEDVLLLPAIYDAGGTTQRDIGAAELATSIRKKGVNVVYRKQREELLSYITSWAQLGDAVIVMGARDDSLSFFAQKLKTQLI